MALDSTHQNAFTSCAERNRRVTATVLATLGSRWSRRWEAAEGDVGVGGRRLHTRARSGRYTGSPVAEVGRVGRGGGLACTRPRPSVRCWRYRDGAKRQIVGGAATGAPTQRVHSRLPAGGKPMVHELKWSAEGTDPPGARQKPPDAGVDDGLRFEHPGPAGVVRTATLVFVALNE